MIENMEIPLVLWYTCINCKNVVDGIHECKIELNI